MSIRVAVDTGGTFTDVVAHAGDTFVTAKAPTTPSSPVHGVLDALRSAALGLSLTLPEMMKRCDCILYATTIGTNALLNGNGALAGLVTTSGFRDVLDLRRGQRSGLWDVWSSNPRPLAQRRLRVGVKERTLADGTVAQPVSEADLVDAARMFAEEGVQAIAVSFLNSYVNAANETDAVRILRRELPEVYVVSGSELAPIQGEYIRTSTATVSAFTGPLVSDHIEGLHQRLIDMDFEGDLFVVSNAGGCLTLDDLAQLPTSTLMSGPGGGVIAAKRFGDGLETPNAVSVDVGGTSTDIGLLVQGLAETTPELEIGGYHIGVQSVDVASIGTGGGSVAWVDSGGLLRVGPQGTGADPGPASFGKGGTLPTLTDANLVNGYLDSVGFFDGGFILDVPLAMAAIQRLADEMATELHETAWMVGRLAENNIARAVQDRLFARGLDPKFFTLVAGGGGAGLHACAVARQVGIHTVRIPILASVYSASGMTGMTLRIDTQRAVQRTLSEDSMAHIRAIGADCGSTAIRRLESRVSAQDRALSYALRMRYMSQDQALEVTSTGDAESWSMDALRAMFEEAHDRAYGHLSNGEDVYVESILATASALTPLVGTGSSADLVGDQAATRHHSSEQVRRVYLSPEDGFADVPVVQVHALREGEKLLGPALVEAVGTTIWLEPGTSSSIDPSGSLVVALEEEQ